jgi:DNA-binding response OmpR family regulator
MVEQALKGRAILVAEDEYYAADDLCRELTRLGATVIGPAPTLERATDLIEGADGMDGAVLDINLGGEMIYPVADILVNRGVPFLFATGYDKSVIPPRFDAIARCEKPIGPERLGTAVSALISKAAP